MSTTITRRLEFDAGHRLQKHESKCRNMHGHRYAVEVEVSAESLDEVGRVIDFGKVKEIIGGWIDENWDHGFIVEESDAACVAALRELDTKLYLMDVPPTAEHMSAHLFVVAEDLLHPHGIDVVEITLWETPNCRATHRRGG